MNEYSLEELLGWSRFEPLGGRGSKLIEETAQVRGTSHLSLRSPTLARGS